jgi:hypothetical protein
MKFTFFPAERGIDFIGYAGTASTFFNFADFLISQPSAPGQPLMTDLRPAVAGLRRGKHG